MKPESATQVLMIDDDENDAMLVRHMLGKIPESGCQFDWAKSYEQGLQMLGEAAWDLCLVDYRLGAHTGVEIVTESYPDQPYQQKIKIYATAKQLPDVFKYWSFSTLLKPLVDGGFVMELNKADFAKYGFVPGSLESNVWGGKLYGIPVSADMWVVY